MTHVTCRKEYMHLYIQPESGRHTLIIHCRHTSRLGHEGPSISCSAVQQSMSSTIPFLGRTGKHRTRNQEAVPHRLRSIRSMILNFNSLTLLSGQRRQIAHTTCL